MRVDALPCQVMEWKDFVPAIEDKCLCLTPFCDEAEVSNSSSPLTGSTLFKSLARASPLFAPHTPLHAAIARWK